MPTVPSWITRAVVVESGPLRTDVNAVKDWRATATQVVVILDDRKRTEIRFRVDNLRPIGAEHRGAELLDSRDPQTAMRILRYRADQAVEDLAGEIARIRLDKVRSDREEQAKRITVLRDKATAALAALEPWL